MNKILFTLIMSLFSANAMSGEASNGIKALPVDNILTAGATITFQQEVAFYPSYLSRWYDNGKEWNAEEIGYHKPEKNAATCSISRGEVIQVPQVIKAGTTFRIKEVSDLPPSRQSYGRVMQLMLTDTISIFCYSHRYYTSAYGDFVDGLKGVATFGVPGPTVITGNRN